MPLHPSKDQITSPDWLTESAQLSHRHMLSFCVRDTAQHTVLKKIHGPIFHFAMADPKRLL